MQMPIDEIKGILVLQNMPDADCVGENSLLAETLKAIPTYIAPILPNGLSNVVVSSSEPTNSQVTKLWVRYDTSGNFIGLYVFTAGQWRLAVQPSPENFFIPHWLIGDSANPPNGYTLITAGGPTYIPAPVRTALVAQYVGAGPYTYAAYIFTGYVP